jgi:hypothetical protein
MTLERASELVSLLRTAQKPPDVSACELFDHFVDYFKLEGEQIVRFAELCGFLIALNVEKLS